MNIFRRNDPQIESDLFELERQLLNTLKPVIPRPFFVRNLRARLFAGDYHIDKKRYLRNLSNILLLVGGIIGSVIMVIASIRGLLSIISRIGTMLHTYNKNTQKQQVTPA